MNFFKERPADFVVKVEVATCFIEWEGQLLLLQYPEEHLFPKKWAIPGGRVEAGESKEQALKRELFEELGFEEVDWKGAKFVQEAFVQRSIGGIRLFLFKWKMEKKPSIQINQQEHLSYCWQPIAQLNQMDLIDNQYDTFRVVYE